MAAKVISGCLHPTGRARAVISAARPRRSPAWRLDCHEAGDLCRLMQGHRFGRDLLLRCRLPSRCTITAIASAASLLARQAVPGSGMLTMSADDALLAGRSRDTCRADRGVGRAIVAAAPAKPGLFASGGQVAVRAVFERAMTNSSSLHRRWLQVRSARQGRRPAGREAAAQVFTGRLLADAGLSQLRLGLGQTASLCTLSGGRHRQLLAARCGRRLPPARATCSRHWLAGRFR